MSFIRMKKSLILMGILVVILLSVIRQGHIYYLIVYEFLPVFLNCLVPALYLIALVNAAIVAILMASFSKLELVSLTLSFIFPLALESLDRDKLTFPCELDYRPGPTLLPSSPTHSVTTTG